MIALNPAGVGVFAFWKVREARNFGFESFRHVPDRGQKQRDTHHTSVTVDACSINEQFRQHVKLEYLKRASTTLRQTGTNGIEVRVAGHAPFSGAIKALG